MMTTAYDDYRRTVSVKKAIFVGTMLALATVTHAQNTTYRQFVEELLEANIKTWLQEHTVIDGIKLQNTRHTTLTQDDIQRLDQQWRTERQSTEQPLINGVLANSTSSFLKEIKEKNAGLFSEIFVMDNKGLNVGQSDVTSDYWQGDEDKWQQTYLEGPGTLFIGKREFDESSGKFLIQISVSVVDPDTQETIGAATIGVNLVQLMRTRLAAAISQ
jgi:hypothetical protein